MSTETLALLRALSTLIAASTASPESVTVETIAAIHTVSTHTIDLIADVELREDVDD